MRLKRLELKAFGPFTDRILEFDSPDPGLHIIFGPNEAGKSSSLRALKALLYGFPQQTSDDFVHSYQNLQVGGSLLGASGKELCFWRRKKRKADLLDAEGNPLDPAVLAEFTHHIESTVFESLYGIDHETLVQGGEDILAQKGQVGQALFAAGAGISSLRKILDSLQAEAEELFKPQGRIQQIPSAIREYKELGQAVREASLSSAKWREHSKRLQEARDTLTRLEEERKQKESEVRRLERLRQAIPYLSELNNLRDQQQNLGEVVVLPPDFPDRVAQTKQEIRDLTLRLDKDIDRREKLRDRQRDITFNQAILEHIEPIEDLHQRLGEYRKGQKDRHTRDGQRISLKKEASSLLRKVLPDVPLEDVESLRPVVNKKRTIQSLSSRHAALTQQLTHSQEQLVKIEKEIKVIDGQLANLPAIIDSPGLTKTIRLCAKAGDIDQHIETLARHLEEEQKSCRATINRLGLWAGEPEQLLDLTLPLAETVHRFDVEYNELKDEYRQLKKDRQKIETDLQRARLAEREIEHGGRVPTEPDLHQARQKREQGWQLLRRQWLNGEDIAAEARKYGGEAPLPQAYEKQVQYADHLADRLRREADRVAKTAALRAEIENLKAALDDINEQERQVTERQNSLHAKWWSEWEEAGIEPLPPREMLAWLREIEHIRARQHDISKQRGELADREKARDQYRAMLLADPAMKAENISFPGPELAPILTHAESVLDAITENKTRLERLKINKTRLLEDLRQAGDAQETAQNKMATWHKDWETALSVLDHRQGITPTEALYLIETIDKCYKLLDNANDFQARIKGIDRDAEQFTDDVKTLVEKIAPDLKKSTAEQAVLQLQSMLGQARQKNELFKNNQKEAEGLTTEIEDAEKTLQSLNQQLSQLVDAAKCDQAEELDDKIRKSHDYRRLEEKISDTEALLARLSEGIPVTEIQMQADAVDVDELPGRIESLKREIEEQLDPEIKDCSQTIGEEKKELQLMDGSGRAAAAAEKMERVASRIRRLVDDYTRIKLAGHILQNEIERYREQHQDPVLRMASDYFADMTLGSFSGLRADVNDKGEPILVGVRGDDSRLTVEGMSSGTRDQLYLSLRLATLEWRLRAGEPMPFIVDDILINFDDARSRATLKALADLGAKNQVILFTHHRQVVGEVDTLAGRGSVVVHEL